jgi:hypothetical protein
MNLLGIIGEIEITVANLIKNDCPVSCDTTYCDECPFRRNSNETTKK